MRKKRILFHSNFHNAFTGFGKNCKNVLSYLYSTGKYEIVEYATGIPEDGPANNTTPWKVIGALPADPQTRSLWNSDPQKQRSMGYGAALIDKIIAEEQPDIYIGSEDIWGFSGYWHKPWWNKTTCAIWTTIDSLPLLPEALNAAPKIKNYFVWSPFAEKAFHQAGYNHVKLLRGSISVNDFFPFDPKDRDSLRAKANILPDDFVVGFVFRNQLRKSVSILLDGFKQLCDNHPNLNSKLLLHTNWSEGWDIPRLIKEKNIDNSKILTTYVCSQCNNYEVKPFAGEGLKCGSCSSPKGQKTTGVKKGVNELQLNEIYNLMDVYCHPFTSGGQEIPIQEAKLTELITLVTNYSCGEDMCTPESGGLPLSWVEYREIGTQFIKATTSSQSIYENLVQVSQLDRNSRKSIGRRAREWVIDRFSKEAVGSQIESFLDSAPFCEESLSTTFEARNPSYTPPHIEDNREWLLDIYKNVLQMEVGSSDEGLKNWLLAMESGRKREDILKFFKETAIKENAAAPVDKKKETLLDLIDDNLSKRLIIVAPKSIGDIYLITALLPSLKTTYPDYAIYFATEPANFPVLNGNPYIYKVIPYESRFDDLLFLEGSSSNEGFFDIAFLPTIGTQKIFNYQHNGKDKIQFDICT